MREAVKKIFFVMLIYVGILLTLKGLFALFHSQLDYFLSNVFPDAATDDLNLTYVLNWLPILYWYFYHITIGFISIAIVQRSVPFFTMFLLLVNVEFFLLMRSNWEFRIWMESIFPDYGGGAIAMFLLISIGIIFIWLLLEVIYILVNIRSKQKEGFNTFLNIFRKLGLVYTIIFSLFHFAPSIYTAITTL
jgi:hypothetical protein